MPLSASTCPPASFWCLPLSRCLSLCMTVSPSYARIQCPPCVSFYLSASVHSSGCVSLSTVAFLPRSTAWCLYVPACVSLPLHFPVSICLSTSLCQHAFLRLCVSLPICLWMSLSASVRVPRQRACPPPSHCRCVSCLLWQ